MATVEECHAALEQLLGRIAEMDAKDRARHLVDRTMSVRVPDLGVTFLTRIGPDGAEPLRQVANGSSAQVKFTANSDVLVSVSDDPSTFVRAWLSGRLKVQGSVLDLMHLRRFT
jgi:predicted lipid carrier protein YhbT